MPKMVHDMQQWMWILFFCSNVVGTWFQKYVYVCNRRCTGCNRQAIGRRTSIFWLIVCSNLLRPSWILMPKNTKVVYYNGKRIYRNSGFGYLQSDFSKWSFETLKFHQIWQRLMKLYPFVRCIMPIFLQIMNTSLNIGLYIGTHSCTPTHFSSEL